MANYRKDVVDLLLPYFRKDPRYHLLVGDMGFGAIDRIKEEFPGRVTNFGIMEQGAVGIAAGMAMTGMVPIVYTIVNFLVFRAIEQMRNDVMLQELNVKFIGTGANDYFGMLGPSHCCGDQDLQLMDLIKVRSYNPYHHEGPFDDLVEQWITDSQSGYMRV